MYLLRHKELYTKQPMQAPGPKMYGEFRCILRDLMGRPVYDTDWFRNVITDVGLADMTNGFWTNMVIGDSAGATNFTDTNLGNQLATTGASRTDANNSGTPNYIADHGLYARFGAGVGTGTIREVGVQRAADLLFARAEVTPNIVKGVDNVLDTYYRLYMVPTLSDVTGQVTISGITYDYTARLYDVDMMLLAFIGLGPKGGSSNSGSDLAQNTNPYDSRPAGETMSLESTDLATPKTYKWQVKAELDDCNFTLPGGIISAYSRLTHGVSAGTQNGIGVGLSQIAGQPNPGSGIPKADTMELFLDWEYSWDRT